MSYLGIDIGTSGVKAVVFSETGQILSSAHQEYPTYSLQPGWFDLDPHEVVASSKAVISKVSAKVRNSDSVRSIGISSQGEAFTVLDKDDKFLCNAMVSFDTRSQKQVCEFTEIFGAERLYNITGHSAHTIFSVFKILWLKENQPQLFARIKRLLCFGDLLGYELTGKAAISYNLAGRTMLFDVRMLEWSDEILYAIGLDKSALSEALPAGYPIGNLKKDIAGELGLGSDVIVTTGGHDQSCGAVGVGAASSGTAAYSMGTVECITPVFEKCILNEVMRCSNLASYPYVLDKFYTSVAFSMTGGNGLKWFRDNFCQYEIEHAVKANSDAYDLMFKQMPVHPSHLLVLPHFTSTGTPYFDPKPTGAILGVGLNTTRLELFKGILEGITFEMRLNLEMLRKAGVAINELRAFGGGTKSRTLMQIKADIFNMPIVSLAVKEAGCLGAAMLGAKAIGDIDLVDDCIKKWIKHDYRYEPDNERSKKYDEYFSTYEGLYDMLKPISKRMNVIKG